MRGQATRWFNGGDLQADLPTLRRDYPQVRLRTLVRLAGRAAKRWRQGDKIGRLLSALAAASPSAAPHAARQACPPGQHR
jgi:hypothetical protein